MQKASAFHSHKWMYTWTNRTLMCEVPWLHMSLKPGYSTPTASARSRHLTLEGEETEASVDVDSCCLGKAKTSSSRRKKKGGFANL
jgi:hypothetical protein